MTPALSCGQAQQKYLLEAFFLSFYFSLFLVKIKTKIKNIVEVKSFPFDSSLAITP